jgi:hypothetical protein
MTAKSSAWVWVERAGAVVLALVGAAIDIPAFLPTDAASFRWLVGGRLAFACALVACIVIGQRWSRVLRLAAWVLLLAGVALKSW